MEGGAPIAMYMFTEMIDFTGLRWRSPDHRTVAAILLIGNRRVNSLDDLKGYAKIINRLGRQRVRELTRGEAAELGIPVN